MKRSIIILGVLCFWSFNPKAQVIKTFNIPAGSSISDAISLNDIYSYPGFVTGTVFFKDGTMYKGGLNYNLLVAQMQFIDLNRDTVSIANENTIKYISIGQDSFFFDKEYLQLLTGNSSVKLAFNEKIKLADKQKIGAFNLPSSGGTIQSYGEVVNGSQINKKLIVKEDIILNRERKYYLGDNTNHFVLMNKKNLLKMFPNGQNAIEKFLKEKSIQLSKQDDLVKLIAFLQELQ